MAKAKSPTGSGGKQKDGRKKNRESAISPSPDVKIIPILTGVGYELNCKLIRDIMGADAYITKPFSPTDLTQLVKN